MGGESGTRRSGLSGGELTIDPTENVKALSAAANQRQDDLRQLNDRRIDAEIRVLAVQLDSIDKMVTLRTEHQRELRRAEADRLDSIRQVDREDVNKTAAQALSAIATLATATTTTAETLRGQVATTAQAAATSLANSMGEVNKRLSALELSSSEGKGKQTVADPMLAELVAEVKRQNAIITSGTGQSQGTKNTVAYIVIGVGLLVSLITIGSAVIAIAFAVRK